MSKTPDIQILEASVKALTETLNELLEAVCEYDDTPLADLKKPSVQAFMKARGCLPKGYSMSLTK